MQLLRYQKDPFQFLDALQDELGRIVNFPRSRNLTSKDDVLAPSLDISEDKENIYVEGDFPGFDQKDISVKIKEKELVISAKREIKKEETKKNYYCCERFQGNLYRETNLPSEIDEGKVSAKYKNGLLRVTLPKKEPEKSKEISIEHE